VVDSIDLYHLTDEDWKEFIEKHERYFKKVLDSTDAQSSKRFVNAIKKIIKEI